MYNKNVRKTVFSLNINNYAPELRELTRPFFLHWVDKIGAKHYEIKTRKFPKLDIEMEKLQIYELSQKQDNDWNIYTDSDALIHPEFYDVTQHLTKDTVAHVGADMGHLRWKYDRYFLRDGRDIGSCNWFAVASDQCIDLWKPIDDLTYSEVLQNIYPIPQEMNGIIKAEHLITDYTLSRNIAKYGLKFTTIMEMNKKLGIPDSEFFFHIYLVPVAEKISQISNTIENWYIHSLGLDEEMCKNMMIEFAKQNPKERYKKAKDRIKQWKFK
jgi:hypothetical protein